MIIYLLYLIFILNQLTWLNLKVIALLAIKWLNFCLIIWFYFLIILLIRLSCLCLVNYLGLIVNFTLGIFIVNDIKLLIKRKLSKWFFKFVVFALLSLIWSFNLNFFIIFTYWILYSGTLFIKDRLIVFIIVQSNYENKIWSMAKLGTTHYISIKHFSYFLSYVQAKTNTSRINLLCWV